MSARVLARASVSITMAACPWPKASAADPAGRSVPQPADPEDRSVLTWVRPATEPSEEAVAFVPSALVSPPPPWMRKAPTRA